MEEKGWRHKPDVPSLFQPGRERVCSLPLVTAPGTHCSEAGPSLAETSLCSLS